MPVLVWFGIRKPIGWLPVEFYYLAFWASGILNAVIAYLLLRHKRLIVETTKTETHTGPISENFNP